jgi:hypothetical protein
VGYLDTGGLPHRPPAPSGSALTAPGRSPFRPCHGRRHVVK